MTLSIPRFAVLLAAPTAEDPDATIELEAKILHGDQVRAELEGPKHGLKDLGETPLAFTGLWIWASLARQHLIEDKYPDFKRRLLTFEPVKDEPVDPTQPAAESDSD